MGAAKAGTYSCFSYSGGGTSRRHACSKTDECPTYLEQAKQVGGVRDLTGCAPVEAVWCFQQTSAEDPDGSDVCQPSPAECTSARDALLKARMSVKTDCTRAS
jgi:hypothetical protein